MPPFGEAAVIPGVTLVGDPISYGLPIFPKFKGLGYSIRRSPIAGNTIIQESVSGKETRIAQWSSGLPRWKFELNFEFLRSREPYPDIQHVPVPSSIVTPGLGTPTLANDWAALAGFFLARQGSYGEFLVDDPDDDSIIKQRIDPTVQSIHLQLTRPIGEYTELTLYPNGTPIRAVSWTTGLTVTAGDAFIPSDAAIVNQSGRLISVQSTGWPCYYTVTANGNTGSIAEPSWRDLAPLPGDKFTDANANEWTNNGTALVMYAYMEPSTTDWAPQYPSTYTVGTRGQITVVNLVGPDSGIFCAWTGSSYYKCRFAQDMQDFELFANRFWKSGKVELISLK